MVSAGDHAPDAELQTPDGDDVRLAQEFDRSPALLAFFKEDCPACKVAVPRLARFIESYEGLALWAVSQDDPASTRAFLIEQAPSLRVVVDAPAFAASRAYGVSVVPTLVLVDRGGTVAAVEIGWDRDRFNGLSGRVAELLDAPYRELVPAGDGPAFRPG